MNEDEQNPEMNEQIRHFSIIADHSALPKKTVDQDDVDLAYQESWGNGTKLGNGLVWEPSKALTWKKVFHQFFSERIVFISSRNVLSLRFSDIDYDVDLDRIQTEGDLLAWVCHLTGKDWMNSERLRLFIEAIATIKGFRIRL
jgi:hypothetical protein